MPALARVLCGVLLAVCLSGCGMSAIFRQGFIDDYGLIYTHKVEPLSLDIVEAPKQPDEGHTDWKTFSFNIVRFDWNSAAIADAAREAGITRIWYADIETLSVFFGLWQQRTAKVYGTGP